MILKRLLSEKSKKAELFRFVLVGGFATVLQYSLYVVFVKVIGVSAVLSTIISYALSFIANFFLSSYFTFKSNPNAKKGAAFTMSHIVNMGLQTGFVAIFKGVVGSTLALLPALVICVPVNYLLVRFAFTSKIFESKKKSMESDDLETEEINLIEEIPEILENKKLK